MTASDIDDVVRWRDANRAHLDAAVVEMRARLAPDEICPADGVQAADARRARLDQDDVSAAAERRRMAADEVPGGPVLDLVAAGFGLTPFERELLVLTVAAEVDAAVGDGCAAHQGGLRRPTFGLATRLLDGGHWSAITPGRPLRRAELVHVGAGALPDAPITPDERLVHHLLGYSQLDDRLLVSAHHLAPCGPQTDSIEAAAAEIARANAPVAGARSTPVVRLVSSVPADARLAVRRAAALAGDDLLRLRAADIPADVAEREHLARLWRREFVLGPVMLLVELDDADPAAAGRVGAFADAVAGPVVVIGPGPLGALRPELAVTLAPTGRDEQRRLWRDHLGGSHASLEPLVERAVGQFSLGISDVVDVADAVAAANGDGATVLWERCRSRTRPGLASLAEHVVTGAGWDDLVLADDDLDVLRTIVEHVRHRATVQEAWGLDHGARGVGISALFHGPSGTGKTLAAEVVANAAGLDLFRIDLSAVVSKYIGETEKNLSRIFDAAEAGGAVLLFDEADALFGKRSEVRDSHDRYANVEVSYLLQRMETYRGLAVLTTNLRQALDTAFLRRLHFVVAFPFPDEVQRAEMWRRVFPPGVATLDLDVDKLARLGLSGASIRGIALHASYAAAASGGPVELDHVRIAARRELAKLDQSLSRGEAMGLL